MRAPDCGDSRLDRQFEIGIGGDIGNRKILLHKGIDQNQETDGHQRQQGASGDRRDRHPTLVVAGGASHRHDARQQRGAVLVDVVQLHRAHRIGQGASGIDPRLGRLGVGLQSLQLGVVLVQPGMDRGQIGTGQGLGGGQRMPRQQQ